MVGTAVAGAVLVGSGVATVDGALVAAAVGGAFVGACANAPVVGAGAALSALGVVCATPIGRLAEDRVATNNPAITATAQNPTQIAMIVFRCMELLPNCTCQSRNSIILTLLYDVVNAETGSYAMQFDEQFVTHVAADLL
jgi:hypothetical protein